MTSKIPRPPSPQDSSNIFDTFLNEIFWLSDFVIFVFSTYGFVIFGSLLLFVGIGFALSKSHTKQNQIQKLWLFTLFFLTKRQMMIPLVIGLSKKDKILDSKTQKKLIEIRQKCREVSFKTQPQKRLELEQEVSEILFFYFAHLEKANQIKPGTKFAKIAADLEFIDIKLIQLQKAYNQEVERWNQVAKIPLMKGLWTLVRLKTFEKF